MSSHRRDTDDQEKRQLQLRVCEFVASCAEVRAAAHRMLLRNRQVMSQMRCLRNHIPFWRKLYYAMIQENDSALLEKLAYDLEAAIFYRFRELTQKRGWIAERDELSSAVTGLNSMRIVKLGWPDPRKPIDSRMGAWVVGKPANTL